MRSNQKTSSPFTAQRWGGVQLKNNRISSGYSKLSLFSLAVCGALAVLAGPSYADTYTLSDDLTLGEYAMLTISGDAIFTDSAKVTIQDNASLYAENMTFQNGASLTLLNGARFSGYQKVDFEGTVVGSNSGSIGGDEIVFANGAKYSAESGINSIGATTSLTFINGAMLEVKSGATVKVSAYASSNSFITFDDTSSITNAGALDIFTKAGTLFSGTTISNSGTLTVSNNSTFEASTINLTAVSRP